MALLNDLPCTRIQSLALAVRQSRCLVYPLCIITPISMFMVAQNTENTENTHKYKSNLIRKHLTLTRVSVITKMHLQQCNTFVMMYPLYWTYLHAIFSHIFWAPSLGISYGIIVLYNREQIASALLILIQSCNSNSALKNSRASLAVKMEKQKYVIFSHHDQSECTERPERAKKRKKRAQSESLTNRVFSLKVHKTRCVTTCDKCTKCHTNFQLCVTSKEPI